MVDCQRGGAVFCGSKNDMEVSQMNNREREQWIDNDEGLYSWWKGSRQSKRTFIKENRADIDDVINNIVGGNKQTHYLVYGPWRTQQ